MYPRNILKWNLKIIANSDIFAVVLPVRIVVNRCDIREIALIVISNDIEMIVSELKLIPKTLYTLLKSDVTRRDHVSVVMDAGSRIVNFIINFIRNGTVFA